MKNFLYLDCEYANIKNKSICQIGLLYEDPITREQIIPAQNFYINPEDGFQNWCVNIHGITEEKVKNEPNFPCIWNVIKQYFTNSIIIGYNVANSDLSALIKNCTRYEIDLPNLYYIDVMQIAKDCIPPSYIENFKLKTLCEFLEINIEQAHNAFDDVCATASVFKYLVDKFNIDYKQYIKNYSQQKTNDFIEYIADPNLRKSMCEFYGNVQGFTLDNKIKPEEEMFIKQWKDENNKYRNFDELTTIFSTIEKILEDNIITLDEMNCLKCEIKKYYNTIDGSTITNSLQELRGILNGMIIDKEIPTEEGLGLMRWLYQNTNLSDHFPYNEIATMFEKVLDDGIITKEESDILIKNINSILNPTEKLHKQILDINNKHICLTGNFSFGQKSDVEKIIIQKGGIIDTNVKQITDIVIMGDQECIAYAHGSYGTKVRRAMELNSKGCEISIIKEKDFFEQINN